MAGSVAAAAAEMNCDLRCQMHSMISVSYAARRLTFARNSAAKVIPALKRRGSISASRLAREKMPTNPITLLNICRELGDTAEELKHLDRALLLQLRQSLQSLQRDVDQTLMHLSFLDDASPN
jgi:hypothetical protein